MLSEGELRSVIRSAIRAPSSHNTQPWLFEYSGDSILLYADRLRALPANDPFDRELTLSCGAALFNLHVAIAALDLSTEVDVMPEGRRSDLLAEVRLGPGPGADERTLAASIDRRRTTRAGFTGEPPDPDTIEAMKTAAVAEGAWIEVVSEPSERQEISDLIAEGDRRQFSDATWRRELASWMHPRRTGDGLAVPGFSRPIAKLVVSAFDLGRTTGRKDARLADEAPCIAVLGTDLDLEENWLMAGQALQRALLVAASGGIQAGYMNQPCQVADLRPRLRSLLGRRDHPQAILRLGYPDPPAEPSPRRDVEQVLQETFPVESRFNQTAP
jgi:hypothetical protein